MTGVRGQVHGELDLEAESVMEEVPRARVAPPSAYLHGPALAVYARPNASEALGRLSVGDEVMCGGRQGRWRKITYPLEGWVQAETRDGRAILQPLFGLRPHLRQVVTLRRRLQDQRRPPVCLELLEPSREGEKAYFRARAGEAARLLRELAWLEGRGPDDGRRVAASVKVEMCGKPRQTVLGIF